MFKKLLVLIPFLFGCDNGVQVVEKEVHDTVKIVQSREKVVVRDTTKIPTNIIYGKVSEKNSSGKILGGFSSVVCTDVICANVNKNGEYYIEKTFEDGYLVSKESGDKDKDTLNTPDSVKIDTGAIVQKVDSTKKDTVVIHYRKAIPKPITDTVVVYKNARKIYEVPVNSWLNVLPTDYVVQRNISGKVNQNQYFSELKSVEALFWSLDSVALMIPLELNGDIYSGFIYQKYNDSSFQKSLRIFNCFVRVLDSKDSVYGLSNVINYSERSGDLIFADIFPGKIARYPRPNYFSVIKSGDNISIVVDSFENKTIQNWYALDSLYSRKMYTYTEKNYETVWRGMNRQYKQSLYKWDTTVTNLVKSGKVDSIGFYVEVSDTGEVWVYGGATWYQKLPVTKGVNFVAYDSRYLEVFKQYETDVDVIGPVSKFKIYYFVKE